MDWTGLVKGGLDPISKKWNGLIRAPISGRKYRISRQFQLTFPRVIQNNTKLKIAISEGLYFPFFTTLCNQTLHFY